MPTTVSTKYALGDRVFMLTTEPLTRTIRCAVCEHTGKVTVKGEEFECPRCHGACLHPKSLGYMQCIDGEGRIGKITVELIDPKFVSPGSKDVVTGYMVDRTGVGTGRIWREELLWPTRAEAQAECDRVNASLPMQNETLP